VRIEIDVGLPRSRPALSTGLDDWNWDLAHSLIVQPIGCDLAAMPFRRQRRAEGLQHWR
jgi:hypothetical protein